MLTFFQAWNRAYQYNLHLYNARVHSYKAGNMDAKNMTDEEAQRYADANEIPMPDLKKAQQAEGASNDQDAIAQQLQQVAHAPVPDMAGETDTKTPKKGAGGRKRKSEVAADADASKVAATPVAPASPDKKRRRTSGKPPAEMEEPKKSGRKKTKSS